MRPLLQIMLHLLADRGHRARLGTLVKFVVVIVVVVVAFTFGFHALMAYEGRQHSWLTGVYWVFTTMTTLGFGDITFTSDLGRMFSVVVMLVGTFLLLVVLPFTFIEYLYSPWMRAQTAGRAPRALPPGTKGQVLFTAHDPIAAALLPTLERQGIRAVLLVADLQEALRLHDAGLPVMVGSPDDPATWLAAGAADAALVVVNGAEMANANALLTLREIAPVVPAVTLARSDAAEEILGLAGATQVLRLSKGLGEALARRIPSGTALEVGRIGGLALAEAPAGPELAGRSLRQAQIRERLGVTVVGRWDHGRLRPVSGDEPLAPGTQIVLCGTPAALAAWPVAAVPEAGPVLILGGGRVGRAAADHLASRGLSTVIVDRVAERIATCPGAVVGDASERAVLERAGIARARGVLVTTHDDDANIFLTILARRLRPDLLLVCRATHERNITTLHRAGADAVLSYASLGAAQIFGLLGRPDAVVVADGLVAWRQVLPPVLAGRRLGELDLGPTGCRILEVQDAAGQEGDLTAPLPEGGSLLLIGDARSQQAWDRAYPG